MYDFSKVDARFFLNNFRRGKELIKLSRDNRIVSPNFKSALHIKLNLAEKEFSEILNKTINDNGIYLYNDRNNENYLDSLICENLFKNANDNNKIILCGNMNSLSNILPENNDITKKLKYEINDINIFLSNKKNIYFEFILKFDSVCDYNSFQKLINGYYYYFKEKNMFFMFDINLFGSFLETESESHKYYKVIIRSERDFGIDEILCFFKNIFKYDISKKLILSNKFCIVNKIPNKGYYRKYVDLFYKYYDKNIILFFSDIYLFNFNNLLIEEYLVSEAIVNLIMNEKK